MNPAACARAKKAARLAREEAMKPRAPQQLPRTPEEAVELARKMYRHHSRPYRRAFRGVITRQDAERFIKARLKKQTRVIEEATSGS